jgi:predicted Zn-dependent protease
MNDEAVAELQKAVQLSGGSPTCVANLARAYVASGQRSKAEKLLSDLKKRSSPSHSLAFEIAVIYVALGDTDQACRRKAYSTLCQGGCRNWREDSMQQCYMPCGRRNNNSPATAVHYRVVD